VKDSIKIGTRGSRLALWQTRWVKSALENAFPGIVIQIVTIKTTGDKILDVPLARVGGKGLFVKEIEESLLQGSIDVAVHSMKDMPARLPEGLMIGAVPERENPLDVLISRDHRRLQDLHPEACVGTSSLRRSVQLKHGRPDLMIRSLRGNLETRIQKLDSGEFDAIVLAAAGMKRMGLESRITEYLEPEMMLPAVGQGALCIEIREADPATAARVRRLDHPDSRGAVTAERAFLDRMGGSCQIPIAAAAILEGERITLSGLVAELDGKNLVQSVLTGPKAAPEALGTQLADRILEMGGREILNSVFAQMSCSDEG